jgi:hypothetical protein
MNRLALLIVIGGFGSGCIIRHEDGGDFYQEPTSSESRVCTVHNDCRSGCFCDLGANVCRTSATCTHDTDCAAGFRCDERQSCVPRPDRAGADGGVTHPQGWPDAGVVIYPQGMDAGVATDARPAGDASPSCDAAATSGTCAPRCRFDEQCGPGARCREGRCQHPCSGGCGTGTTCTDGFCTSGGAGGMCVYASQCGATGTCINGYCHAGCTTNTDCPNHADVCDRGVCRPDERPLPPCTADAQCTAGQSCVDGLCRAACGCDADCASWGAGAICTRGFCAAPEESTVP